MVHDRRVSAFAFSSDGLKVATADGSSLRIWDCLTGFPLCQPIPGTWQQLAFSGDGRRLAGIAGERGERKNGWLFEIPGGIGRVPAWVPAAIEAIAGQTIAGLQFKEISTPRRTAVWADVAGSQTNEWRALFQSLSQPDGPGAAAVPDKPPPSNADPGPAQRE